MKGEVFGHIGIRPDDFYRMKRKDFWLLRKGWDNKLIYEQMITRRAAYIIHCSLVQKPAALRDLWPLPGDDGKTMSVVSEAVKELLRKQKEKVKKCQME